MAKKTENKRCPFQQECERKCEYELHELDCDYYFNNAFGDFIIKDQEEIREARERTDEENRIYSDEFEYHEDVTGEIEHIPIKLLHRHHQNPRKDLGDLTELADSIKAKGVLQNLTVVPFWFETTGAGEDRPEKQAELGYLVVIGNRRLEAAKLTGLETLPCIISNMSKEEQLQTMAVENIQRKDLSAYDQAQCFQMMMNVGSSVADVSKQTGFSETTIRRRLEWAKLDSDTMKEVSGRQISFGDLDKLAQIDDIEQRNKVLTAIGTRNFDSELDKAIHKQKAQVQEQLWQEALEAAGVTQMSYEEMSKDHNLNYYRYFDVFAGPEKANEALIEGRKFYFAIKYNGVYLYVEKIAREVKTDPDAERMERERAERRQKEEAAKEAFKRAFRLRVNRQPFLLLFRNTASSAPAMTTAPATRPAGSQGAVSSVWGEGTTVGTGSGAGASREASPGSAGRAAPRAAQGSSASGALRQTQKSLAP